jgi:hypothetical protein
MLKKGFAWHYTAYDQRPELAKVSSARLTPYRYVNHLTEKHHSPYELP